MPTLINKTTQLTDSDWINIENDQQLSNVQSRSALSFTLPAWESLASEIKAKQPEKLQLMLLGHDEIDSLTDVLDQFSVISIHFAEFKDGRGYSLARLLRDRHGYKGELRATGDVTLDQLFYLSRCGFDTFLLRSDQDPSLAFKAFNQFSQVYQASADQPSPIYNR